MDILSQQQDSKLLPRLRMRVGAGAFGLRFRIRVRRLKYAGAFMAVLRMNTDEASAAPEQRRVFGIDWEVGGGGGRDGQAKLIRFFRVIVPVSGVSLVHDFSQFHLRSYWEWTVYEVELHWLPGRTEASGEGLADPAVKDAGSEGRLRVRIRYPAPSQRYGQALAAEAEPWIQDQTLQTSLGPRPGLASFGPLVLTWADFIGGRDRSAIDMQVLSYYGALDFLPSEGAPGVGQQMPVARLFVEARKARRKGDFDLAARKIHEAWSFARNAEVLLALSPKKSICYESERCVYHALRLGRELLEYRALPSLRDPGGLLPGEALMHALAEDRIWRERLIAIYTTPALDPTADGVPDVETAFARAITEELTDFDFEIRGRSKTSTYLRYLRYCADLRKELIKDPHFLEHPPKSVEAAKKLLARDPWNLFALRFLAKRGDAKARTRIETLARSAGLH